MCDVHPMPFKGVVEGYVANYLKKHMWRVSASYEREDLMQEARLCHLVVTQKYPDVEDRHLMSLFKTSWERRFIDLSSYSTKNNKVTLIDVEPEGLHANVHNDGPFMLMLNQAPKEVTQVLSLLFNTPQEFLDLACKSWKKRGRKKPLGNKHLAELLGLPKNADPLGAVARYFSQKN